MLTLRKLYYRARCQNILRYLISAFNAFDFLLRASHCLLTCQPITLIDYVACLACSISRLRCDLSVLYWLLLDVKNKVLIPLDPSLHRIVSLVKLLIHNLFFFTFNLFLESKTTHYKKWNCIWGQNSKHHVFFFICLFENPVGWDVYVSLCNSFL